jgi:tRNA threonylcarbamoyladenosine modification (KEOPS) complex  Pcc1 subunit
MSEITPGSTVPTRLKVTVEFDNEEEARTAFEALKVDDDEFITTNKEGRVLVAEVRATGIDSARRAADDWMACLIATRSS